MDRLKMHTRNLADENYKKLAALFPNAVTEVIVGYEPELDFVYEDDFAEDADSYLERSGQFDDQGNRLEQNTESNGRFHTDWLNMIYSRLKMLNSKSSTLLLIP